MYKLYWNTIYEIGRLFIENFRKWASKPHIYNLKIFVNEFKYVIGRSNFILSCLNLKLNYIIIWFSVF